MMSRGRASVDQYSGPDDRSGTDHDAGVDKRPMAEAGGQIVGLDWRVDMADARQMLGPDRAVQGNMDPVSLLADLDTLKARAKAVFDVAGTTGHIFNLGHGVSPEVPPESAKALVEIVHELGAEQRA